MPQHHDERGQSTVETATVVVLTLASIFGAIVILTYLWSASTRLRTEWMWWQWAALLGGVAVTAAIMRIVWVRLIRPSLIRLEGDLLIVKSTPISKRKVIDLSEVRGITYEIEPAGSGAYEHVAFWNADPEFHKVSNGDGSAWLDSDIGPEAWVGSIGLGRLACRPELRTALRAYIEEHQIPSSVDLVQMDSLYVPA